MHRHVVHEPFYRGHCTLCSRWRSLRWPTYLCRLCLFYIEKARP